MNFVQRSSFPLTTLSLQNLALSDSNLVDLLRHLPTLVNLIVDDKMLTKLNPLTEQFTSSLHAYRPSPLRSNASPIVPRLQSLTLSCGASTFNDAAIVDMVRSRWIPSARLGSSSVAETSYMSPLQVDCLREFTMRFRARTKENNVVYMPLERLEKDGLRAVVLWGQK
ncbi:hypothetical protein D9757_010003 [Collybiopsis confluens]|uniref:Uncharacterized protein n=1 Tax=Collybiopsis confluens TaxID=2823264 RepID=A0A8H5LVY7_9AGAR|nr:hypothetical protein D9757_010003 [Collybiopsis confluens]